MATLPRVGFLGAGNMATALVRGICTATDGGDRFEVAVTDLNPARSAELQREQGVHVCADGPELLEWAEIVVLAIKPQGIGALLQQLAGDFHDRHLLISIAAGIRTETLAAPLSGGTRIVRAMPNTPALVGAGATALSVGPHASADDMQLAQRLFQRVGRVVQVQEDLMDAVTGVSGSGPAYIFVAIEALADAGVREGLPRDVALQLAAQTVAGAAQMVLQTGEHPAALKDRVTSPGGTTIAAIAALEEHGLRHALHSAVRAAKTRASELA